MNIKELIDKYKNSKVTFSDDKFIYKIVITENSIYFVRLLK